MKYEVLKDLAREMPAFTTADVVALSGEDRSSVLVHLHRWVRAGRIQSLRRGVYTLNDEERKVPLGDAYIASILVEPSYLSGVWMLSQHAVIPEAVFTVTSATLGRTRQFENKYGRFAYSRLPERSWFGYRAREIQGHYVLCADLEKALLDTIYWSKTVWEAKRFQQERVDADRIEMKRLMRYAKKWGDAKLKRSVDAFKIYKEETCLTW